MALVEKALLLNRHNVNDARKWILEHLRSDDDELSSRVQLEPKAVRNERRCVFQSNAMGAPHTVRPYSHMHFCLLSIVTAANFALLMV